MEEKAIVRDLIISTVGRAGSGQDFTSPIRVITQVFTKDGVEIARADPYSFTIEYISEAVRVAFYEAGITETSGDLKYAILQKLKPLQSMS